jgi:putative phosphoribosyl transferase
MMPVRFPDRREAGRQLAEELHHCADRSDVIVLALPRGGVPVAHEVALALRAPLDVFLVRKLGVPGQEELAMGAIATGGVQVLNEEVLEIAQIAPEEIERVAAEERIELLRRERAYRGDRPPPDLSDRIVILVDDGLATGSSMRAAAQAVRRQGPARIIVAVPTAARETVSALRAEVDEVVCLMTPEPFYAVGVWYEDFTQTSDEEVRSLLESASQRPGPGSL